MIDPARLRAFMHGFYGYGCYDAKYWFIGQEEGGASSVSALAARVDAWHERGAREIEDLQAFHAELRSTRWFGAKAKRQATWARLIQIVLMAEGRPCTNLDVLRYQSSDLGRPNGETSSRK